MKIIYNPEVDVLPIRLSDAAIEESDEETPGVVSYLNGCELFFLACLRFQWWMNQWSL